MQLKVSTVSLALSSLAHQHLLCFKRQFVQWQQMGSASAGAVIDPIGRQCIDSSRVKHKQPFAFFCLSEKMLTTFPTLKRSSHFFLVTLSTLKVESGTYWQEKSMERL